MNTRIKTIGALILFGFIVSFLLVSFSVAAAQTEYGYTPIKGKNPSYQEMNRLLTTIAIKYNVPPEIVKAVATVENGGWKQFEENGEAVISSDGGIGVMQITQYDPNLEEQLKNNVIVNIEEGVKLLAGNFSRTDLPKMNKHDPSILENWYFAVMAYNGIKPINSPIYKCTADQTGRNKQAYQEKVFAALNSAQETITKVSELPFKEEDFTYTCGSSENIVFNKKQYNTDFPLTKSQQTYGLNDYVVTNREVRVREKSSTTNSRVLKELGNNTTLKITGSFTVDLEAERKNQFLWYPIQSNLKASSTLGFVPSKYVEKVGMRISGKDRYDTAVKISQQGWNKANTVILARGDDFPDALAGAPLAYKLDAPILLTHADQLTASTKNEIARLGAKRIIILGGTSAVSENVQKALISSLNVNKDQIERIAGSNRYDTAKRISERLSKELGDTPKTAIIAFGYNFPDALAIAPYAAKNGYPILLTDKEKLPYQTREALAGITNTIVMGYTEAISEKVEKELPKPIKRIGGINRYDTAAKIIEETGADTDTVFFATGLGFADALTGSVLAAREGSPLLLVNSNEEKLSNQTNLILQKKGLIEFKILGGEAVVQEEYAEVFTKYRR